MYHLDHLLKRASEPAFRIGALAWILVACAPAIGVELPRGTADTPLIVALVRDGEVRAISAVDPKRPGTRLEGDIGRSPTTVIVLEYGGALDELGLLPGSLVTETSPSARPLPLPLRVEMATVDGATVSDWRSLDCLPPVLASLRIPPRACPTGQHDGGGGLCWPKEQCAPGFLSQGAACVALDAEPHERLDGAKDACLPNGACLSGHRDRGDGVCRSLEEACVEGAHDDGRGRCVPLGHCAKGFHDGGRGRCFEDGTCEVGFHDGGCGACIWRGACADGWHAAGDGTCAPAGMCADGFQLVNGACIVGDQCPEGMHDGGYGLTCSHRLDFSRPLESCASGYRLDLRGVCYRFRTAARMSTRRSDHAAFPLDDGATVLLVGGENENNAALATTEICDVDSGSCRPGPDLPERRSAPLATVLPDGRMLVAAGNVGEVRVIGSLTLRPMDSAWSNAPPMPLPVVAAPGVTMRDGNFLVAGGWPTQGVNNTPVVQLFDFFTNRWTTVAELLTARYAAEAELLADGRVLVTGGGIMQPGVYVRREDAAEVYDPRSNRWQKTEPMIAPRGSHSLTRLLDGRVLAAGGWSPDAPEGITASAELYDPASNRWSETGKLTVPRASYTRTLLPDGRVLAVGGGTIGGPRALASAEIYDPLTGAWSALGVLGTGSEMGRAVHTATLLRDGRVVFAGGTQWAEPRYPRRDTVVVYEVGRPVIHR